MNNLGCIRVATGITFTANEMGKSVGRLYVITYVSTYEMTYDTASHFAFLYERGFKVEDFGKKFGVDVRDIYEQFQTPI